MKVSAEGADTFLLQVSGDELRLIHGVLREVCFGMADFEFEARIGVTPEVAKAAAVRIREEVERVGLDL